MATSLLSRPFDLLLVAYFIVHIPTTLLVDIQSIVPRDWFPAFAVQAVDWHIATNKDFLVQNNPPFFKSLVWAEAVFQFPLFFLLAWGIAVEAAWARIPSIIYGTHVATTLIPILTELLFSETYMPVPNVTCALIYLPYFIIPAALVLRMWLWDFPAKGKAKGGKAKAKAQ